ncbi:MAG: hypothetical protein V3U76_15400 [Granulosicoccus sp.]
MNRDIKCRACNTTMLIDHCETANSATTYWHRCPFCASVRLTSEPNINVYLARQQHPDDDTGYAVESTTTGPLPTYTA